MRVLCAEPSNFSRAGLTLISSFVSVDIKEITQEDLSNAIAGYGAVMVRLRLRIDKEILDCAGSLKAILTPTTGIDHIDLEGAHRLGIEVISLRNAGEFLKDIFSTAEHTFALLLSLIRKIPEAVNSVKTNRWEQLPFRGTELAGKSLGLLGVGRVGSQVARYAEAFGMNVFAYDPFVSELPRSVRSVSHLEDLLIRSNILSLHVPLCEDTRGIIGEKQLSLLPPGSFLINTSRGAIIDEKALLKYLLLRHLAGAAIDVIDNEHLLANNTHPLIEYAKSNENLLITPHIAGACQEAIEKTDVYVINRFRNWLREHPQLCL